MHLGVITAKLEVPLWGRAERHSCGPLQRLLIHRNDVIGHRDNLQALSDQISPVGR